MEKKREGDCSWSEQQVQSPWSRSEGSELSGTADGMMRLAAVSREKVGRRRVDGGVQMRRRGLCPGVPFPGDRRRGGRRRSEF